MRAMATSKRERLTWGTARYEVDALELTKIHVPDITFVRLRPVLDRRSLEKTIFAEGVATPMIALHYKHWLKAGATCSNAKAPGPSEELNRLRRICWPIARLRLHGEIQESGLCYESAAL